MRRGEIFGFLGPNGAGKSTSIKMFLGLVTPTSGDAFVLGSPSASVAVRRQIGFLPEDFRFYHWLTATELLYFHGQLCELPAGVLRTRIPETLNLVGLAPHADRRLRGFSKGMLQRIGLAQAILHEPQLIFLDEPTSGLDPIGRRMVRDVLRAQRERGATVFLNSHLLSEIEVTCDRVAFIQRGEVVGSHDLSGGVSDGVRVRVETGGLPPGILDGLGSWTTSTRVEGVVLHVTATSRPAVADVLRYLVAHRVDVFECTTERASLEELFLQIMGGDAGL